MQVKFVWFSIGDAREQEEAEKTISELVSLGWVLATPDFRTTGSGGSFTHHEVIVMLVKED